MSNSLFQPGSVAQQLAKSVGVKIVRSSGAFQSNDVLTLECLACLSPIKQEYLVRKIKEKASKNERVECRYCNIKAAIPAILAYLNYQSKDKLTEKDAKARVMNEFGVNPASQFQSFRNDYRDDKLTQECRSLLEMTFPGLLEKKKQGNKFSDEQLVTFLEKLYGEKPLSEQELLQSEKAAIKRFRKQKAEGKLDPKLETRLLALRINLAPEKVFTTQERLEQLVAFVKANRRLPREKEFEQKRKDGDEDAGLYDWQRDMFFKIKHGKLADGDLASELIAIRNQLTQA